MNPNQNSEYEFIIGEATEGPVQQQPLAPGPSKSKKKLFVFTGIGLLAVIIIAVTASLLSGGGDKTATNMISIARQQGEIIRIAQLGVKKSSNAATKAFAITTQTTVKSDNGSMLAYMKSNALPSSAKEIGASSTADKTDNLLTEAEQANQFDPVFEQLLVAEITKYQKLLKQTYGTTTSASTKTLINQFYQHTELLTPKTTTE